MRVTWLLDPPSLAEIDDISGLQADGLAARGHEVRLVAIERPPFLRGARLAEWIEVEDWRHVDTSRDDVVVATSWRTARIAATRGGARTVHLCQSFEAPPADAPEVPMIVIGAALLDHWARAGADAFDAGAIVDDETYRRATPREHEPLRVLLAGPSQAEVKGVDEGYGAVAHARWFHQTLDLVRVSPWAPSREEPLEGVQEFHVGLNPDEMRRLLHSCDIVLAPSRAEEGFGLTAAEAMAAGIPTVLTSIPAYTALAEPRDFAQFGPERNAVELGEKLIELLEDDELRERLRARGREVAEQWRMEAAAERLERYFDSLSGG